MRTTLLWTAAALLMAGSLARAAADPARLDLVFLGDERPVLVRLHVEIDGKPFRTYEEDYFRKLFRYFDRDADGFLNEAEAGRTPLLQILRQARINGYYYALNTGVNKIADFDTQPFDGKVSIDEFMAHYRKGQLFPVELTAGQMVSSAPVNDTFFKYLDRDNDGKITKTEFDQAEAALRKFDVNDDEVLTLQEIAQAPNGYNFYQQGQLQSLIQPDAARVLARYDRNKDQRLSRAELNIRAAHFDRLDLDKSGDVNVSELAGLFAADPDLDLVVKLGKSPSVENRDARDAVKLNAEVKQRFANAELQVLALGNGQRYNYNLNLVRQFEQIDSKKQGFIDAKILEGKRQFQYFANLIPLMDHNGDGKLTKEELIEYGELLSEVTSSYVHITVQGSGQGLFQLLDGNNDGRLGLRELRTLWSRVAPQDSDKDEALSRTELPEHVELLVSAGRSALSPNGMMRRPVMVRPVVPGPVQAAAKGPAWFRKMDANGDGDVSRREWIGTDAEFARLDRDGDGLIDLAEVEALPAKVVEIKPAP